MQSVLGKRTTSKLSSQGWMAPVKIITISSTETAVMVLCIAQDFCCLGMSLSARLFSKLSFSVGHLNTATSLDPLSHLHASLIQIKRFYSMNSSPWSHILCSKHLSSSFQTSIYSFGPHGRQTLSEVAVHLADKYFPVIEKRTSRLSGSCRAAV